MAKGYWIVSVDVSDATKYAQYVAANAAAFSKYGANFLVRGGMHTVKEGAGLARNVVIEFKDYATALACYDSAEYQHACEFRKDAAQANILVIEGYDGPQPELKA